MLLSFGSADGFNSKLQIYCVEARRVYFSVEKLVSERDTLASYVFFKLQTHFALG